MVPIVQQQNSNQHPPKCWSPAPQNNSRFVILVSICLIIENPRKKFLWKSEKQKTKIQNNYLMKATLFSAKIRYKQNRMIWTLYFSNCYFLSNWYFSSCVRVIPFFVFWSKRPKTKKSAVLFFFCLKNPQMTADFKTKNGMNPTLHWWTNIFMFILLIYWVRNRFNLLLEFVITKQIYKECKNLSIFFLCTE